MGFKDLSLTGEGENYFFTLNSKLVAYSHVGVLDAKDCFATEGQGTTCGNC